MITEPPSESEAAAPSHPPWVLRGACVMTAAGERMIETLRVGDKVSTHFGGAQPIVAIDIERVTFAEAARPWRRDWAPVRIMRHALGPGAPHTELVLAAGHALYLNGALAPVGRLVNNTSIAFAMMGARRVLDYVRLRLAAHDVVILNGAWCETAQPAGAPLCAPRLDADGAVQPPFAAIRARLDARARQLANDGVFNAAVH